MRFQIVECLRQEKNSSDPPASKYNFRVKTPRIFRATKCPYVNNSLLIPAQSLTVALVVLGVMRPPEARTQAKVRQLDVPIPVNENIVRFDVTMNETHLVNTLHSARQFSNVKPGE